MIHKEEAKQTIAKVCLHEWDEPERAGKPVAVGTAARGISGECGPCCHVRLCFRQRAAYDDSLGVQRGVHKPGGVTAAVLPAFLCL